MEFEYRILSNILLIPVLRFHINIDTTLIDSIHYVSTKLTIHSIVKNTGNGNYNFGISYVLVINILLITVLRFHINIVTKFIDSIHYLSTKLNVLSFV